jgi:ribose transport system permease protein
MNTKKKFQFNINTWLPIFVFVLIFVVFTILTGGRLLSGRNLTNIFNQSVATIIAAAGMMFVAAMGGTDISTGVVVALAGTFGLMAADSSNSVVFILISIAIGIASGMLLGFVNAKLKVNSFMASLALMMAYRALVNLIVSNKSYYLPEDLEFLDNTLFKVIVVIVILLIVFYIWNYTRIGNYIRGIGENEVAIQHTGVNVVKMKIIAFTMSGLLAAIAGIFFVARNGGVSNTTGSGFEMKVMMALYIAGMPVAGGEGTRVYKLIFGAPTIIMLENGLTLCGLDAGVTQLVRGLVLLAAVCLSSQLANRMAYVGQSGAVNQKAEAAREA